MGTLAVAAALAVCTGALVAVLASRARGLTTGIVLAGAGALLVEGTVPEPVRGAFGGVAVVLAAYLVAVSVRDGEAFGGGWSGVAFVAIGMVAGVVFVPWSWPLGAAAGAAVAASVVLLWREDTGPSVACGAILGLAGARLIAGELGLVLGSLGEGALDLAMVGAGASALAGRTRTHRWETVEAASIEPVAVDVAVDVAAEPATLEAPTGQEDEVEADELEPDPAGPASASPSPEDPPSAEIGPLPVRRRGRKPPASEMGSRAPAAPTTPEPLSEPPPSPRARSRRRGSSGGAA